MNFINDELSKMQDLIKDELKQFPARTATLESLREACDIRLEIARLQERLDLLHSGAIEMADGTLCQV
jgi:hypothetical protein